MTKYTIQFEPKAVKQLKKMRNNKKYLKKVFDSISEIGHHPYTGIGKPEPLKYQFQGKWSRRIDQQNRLIYEVIEPNVIIISVIGHYE